MTITALFILLTIIVIFGFDLWVILKRGKQQSVSAYIIRYSKRYPIAPFLLGIVCGHLTWSMSDFDYKTPEAMIEKCEKFIEENKK
jgi:hypothetical protein